MENFTAGFFTYINTIDWGYIVPFLCLSFLLNKWVDKNDANLFAILRTRYRVFLLGTVYAAVVFLIRGYHTRAQSEQLLQAYLFGVVFYSLVVDIPVKWAEDYIKNSLKAKVYGNDSPNESV
jgi:hypothetical protein